MRTIPVSFRRFTISLENRSCLGFLKIRCSVSQHALKLPFFIILFSVVECVAHISRI